MAKYIDAEKLKAEIERLKTIQLKRIQEGDLVDAEPYDKSEAYNELLSFIDSLQQEHSDVDLDAEIEMQWDSFNKHIVYYNDESEDEVWLNLNSFIDVARYFYELGKNSK